MPDAASCTREVFVALLRGINVGGRHKVSMAELRSTCESLGCEEVRTHIQSGNLVFVAGQARAELETALMSAIERDFGFAVPVIVRSGKQWDAWLDANPCDDQVRRTPNHVLLAVSVRRPGADALSRLQEYATQGERLARSGDAIWIHYSNGIGRSGLSPAVLDRCVGSPVTARNWRTVSRLSEMVRDSRSRIAL